jgi:tripartite ATP-independent transporter DctM subunit
MQSLFYLTVVFLLCRHHPDWGPVAPRAAFCERIVSLRDIWPVAVLFFVVIGGLYSGAFTPSEAAGVGAFGAFFIAVLKRRLTPKGLVASVNETSKTVGNMFCILVGAMILGKFLAVTRLPFDLVEIVMNLNVNRYVVLFFIIVVYLMLGAIMDTFSVMVLTIPIVFPVVTALGFNPIWYGVVVTRLFEVGALTPPFGINVFVLKSVAKDIPIETMFKGVTPFFISDIIGIVVLVIFPEIATFLPDLMK